MIDIDALADTALDSAEMLHTLAQDVQHPLPSALIPEVDGAYTDLLDALNSLVASAKEWKMKERALTDYFADASRRADKERKRADAAEREQDEQRSLKVLAYQQLDLTKARVVELEAIVKDARDRADGMARAPYGEFNKAVERAEQAGRQIALIKTHLNARCEHLVERAERAERERDEALAERDSLWRPTTEMEKAWEAAEARVAELTEAAMVLYERVEMDESVGICLSSRSESLLLGRVLASPDQKEGTA